MATSELRIGCLSCSVLLLTSACELPSVDTKQDGPDVILTMAEPVAEFDVTLCIDLPRKINSVFPSASIEAKLEPSGENAGLVRGHAEHNDEVSDDNDEHRDELELPVSGDEMLYFTVEAEAPWDTGRHCTAPQRVRFDYEGQDPAAEVRLRWHAHLSASYSHRRLRDPGFGDEDLTIEIEPVPVP